MIDVTSTSPVSRPPVSEPIKNAIRDAFAIVPEGKKNAFLGIYDIDTKKVRLHYAWKIDDMWKVGAQIGWSIHSKPTGFVGVEAAW